MSELLTALCGLAYAACAVDLYLRGMPGHALMFAGYALANIGIIWQVRTAAGS